MSVKKSFSLFVSIVAVSVVAVLFFSIDSSTFDIIKNADRRLVALAGALVAIVWCLDALKFICLLRAAGEKLSFKKTLSVVWINYFGCAITPMQSGGGPFQVYMLYRNGVSVGKSVAVTLIRTVQILFILACIVPFALVTEDDFISKHFMLKFFVCYVLVFITAAVIFIVMSVIKPQPIKKLGNWIVVKFNKFGFIRSERILRIARIVNREIDAYSSNVKLFLSTGKAWFFVASAVAVAHLLVYMSIMPVLIIAMGYNVDFMQCFLAESLFLFLLYFVPTPGGSGAAEGGAAAVFALFVPWNLAGVMAVAWRVVSEYTGVLLGTVITLRLLGWGEVDDVLHEERARVGNDKRKD